MYRTQIPNYITTSSDNIQHTHPLSHISPEAKEPPGHTNAEYSVSFDKMHAESHPIVTSVSQEPDMDGILHNCLHKESTVQANMSTDSSWI